MRVHVLSVQYFKVSTMRYEKEHKPPSHLRASQCKSTLGNDQIAQGGANGAEKKERELGKWCTLATSR